MAIRTSTKIPRVLHRLRKSFSASRRIPILCAIVIASIVFLIDFTAPDPPLLINPPRKPLPTRSSIVPPTLTKLQQDVKDVTRVMYREYLDKCIGKDELVPATGACEDWFGVGLTALDSLDTLILMGLTSEYEESREWAAKHLDFGKVMKSVSVFEIVIRALGGMNSAYELTGDALWMRKSVELADLLLEGFSMTEVGCPPPSMWVGKSEQTRQNGDDDDDDNGDGDGIGGDKSGNIAVKKMVRALSNPAEAGTLQLEFRTLSRMTGDRKYGDAVDKCEDSLVGAAETAEDGVVTDGFDLNSGQYTGSRLTIGGLVDSFYELLVKTWVGFGKKDEKYVSVYQKAVEGIYKHLVKTEGELTFVGQMSRGAPRSFAKRMDHLACFFPGNLAYAALHGLGGGVNGSRATDYMPRARELTRTCYEMSRGMYHGLAGEVTRFDDGKVKPMEWQDNNYLRPEIVEALFYLDMTDPMGGRKYKEWGEQMWKSTREWSQVPGKPDGILSTTEHLLKDKGSLVHGGKLHSFAIAETFKYFFLLFDERRVNERSFPLDEWVFNTEAHPVRIVEAEEYRV